jgi:hypothetical protein
MAASIEFIRSLGFGGLLGAGSVGLVYALFPTLIAAPMQLEQLLVVGGLLGAGLHGLINRALVKSVLSPLASTVGLYSQILQILALTKLKVIPKARSSQLISSLTERYFLSPSRGVDDPLVISAQDSRRVPRGKMLPPPP